MEPMPITTSALASATPRFDAAGGFAQDDDLLRDHFADGWDSDDAMLGWVDETVLRSRRPRLH
ncbi:hypothetical protein [Lysobacter xanthus]